MSSSVGQMTARAEDQVEHSNKREWIQRMKDFRRLLFGAERSYFRGKKEESIEEPIKFALIDDGVDIKDLEYSFLGGRTFCKHDPEHIMRLALDMGRSWPSRFICCALEHNFTC